MDGLEEQAEAEVQRLVERIFTHEILEIRHSSRNRLMMRITEALQEATAERPPVVKTLILRSGASVSSLNRLQEALATQPGGSTVQALEFYSLSSIAEITAAINCCSSGHNIQRLSLSNYSPYNRRQNIREAVALALRDGIFGTEEGPENNNPTATQQHSLTHVSITGYPLGTSGAQILAEPVAHNRTLEVLKLMDCDLRSDAASSVACMIRGNTHLRDLDLSYNRHYLGSPLTREMTLKTLVRQGLQHNSTLLRLGMRQTPARSGSAAAPPITNARIEAHLNMNRFRFNFLEQQRDPANIPPRLWPHLLARVAAKSDLAFLFVRESVPAGLFQNE